MLIRSFLHFFAGSTQEQKESTALAVDLPVEEVVKLANESDSTPEKKR